MKQSTAAIVAGGVALAGILVILGAQVVHPPAVCAASPAVAAADATGEQVLEVQVTGATDALRDVVLCTARGCSRPLDVRATAPATPGIGLTEQKLSPTLWRFVLAGEGPSTVTATAVDAADMTLATKSFHAVWVDDPGSSGCAASVGPDPLTLPIPAG